MKFVLTEEFRERPVKLVFLTKQEQQRLLQLLHIPVPPGPLRDLDNRLIRKLS